MKVSIAPSIICNLLYILSSQNIYLLNFSYTLAVELGNNGIAELVFPLMLTPMGSF